MLDSKLLELLPHLSETEYVTSQYLAAKGKISDRTVQTRIRKLREELEGHGATVEARQRHGYKLVVEDRERYEFWYCDTVEKQARTLPNSPEERFEFLLVRFLCGDGYSKLEDLSEELYVSSKTLSTELKNLEFVLSHYDLVLKRKPHYGICLSGSEFNKRKCCMDYLIRPNRLEFDDRRTQVELTSKIGEILLDVMLRQRIHFSEAAFQNIVIYLYVTVVRNRAGKIAKAEPGKLQQIQVMPEYESAKLLVSQLRDVGIAIVPEPAEFMYIAVYIAGRRSLGNEYKLQANPVLLDNVNRLSSILLDCMQRVYNLNFRDNLNIRISLYNHIATFHIRMLYDIPMQNPILDETKQNYPFAFAMAQRGMVEFEKFYGKKIPEAETGYFAILLEMALESLKADIVKKNILLVCITGKASSQFLVFRLRNEFGVYIDRLDVCSVYEFEKYDLHDIDYVFTTVPLQSRATIPVYEISNFLDSHDVPRVRKNLELGSVNFLKDYYRQELFFPHVRGSAREEVIRELCTMMEKVYPLPEGFCESVLARERMGDTDFGNLVAIPHPEEWKGTENIVCVGILDKAIRWSRNIVQLVVLAAIYDSTTQQAQKFYQLTNALLADSTRIRRIISRRSYPHFMKLFLE